MGIGRGQNTPSDPDANESIGEDIKEAQRVSGSVHDEIRTGEHEDMVPDASGRGTVSRAQRAAEEAVSEGGNKGTVKQASQEGDRPDTVENVGTVKQASQEGDDPDTPENTGTVQQASQEGDDAPWDPQQRADEKRPTERR